MAGTFAWCRRLEPKVQTVTKPLQEPREDAFGMKLVNRLKLGRRTVAAPDGVIV